MCTYASIHLCVQASMKHAKFMCIQNKELYDILILLLSVLCIHLVYVFHPKIFTPLFLSSARPLFNL